MEIDRISHTTCGGMEGPISSFQGAGEGSLGERILSAVKDFFASLFCCLSPQVNDIEVGRMIVGGFEGSTKEKVEQLVHPDSNQSSTEETSKSESSTEENPENSFGTQSFASKEASSSVAVPQQPEPVDFLPQRKQLKKLEEQLKNAETRLAEIKRDMPQELSMSDISKIMDLDTLVGAFDRTKKDQLEGEKKYLEEKVVRLSHLIDTTVSNLNTFKLLAEGGAW